MTNPNNAVGTNGAFGGRTSVNAFNDVLSAFQNSGVLSGWGIVPSSGMTVSCGGSGLVRDVAVAEDANGNKTSVNNISGSAIDVTLNTAPASNSRYDAIVVYVDKPPMGSGTQDNPECCGIIPVTGTAASTPSYPDDNAIRSAITADGASGATAYYAIIGYVLVASGTTTISSGMIISGPNVTIGTNRIEDGAITSSKIANNAVTTNAIANAAVTAQKFDWSTIGWQNYTSITVPTGYTILENHSRINYNLKLFSLSLRLQLPSSGTGTTYASNVPIPFGNETIAIFARVEVGTLTNQNPGLWIRAWDGTIGGANVSQAQVSSIQIGGMYPIK